MHRSTAKTYGLAHSTATARAYVRRNADGTSTTAKRSAEMLRGGAAEEAFVSLFEGFEDFDAMAREACQAPLPTSPVTPLMAQGPAHDDESGRAECASDPVHAVR